VPAVLGEFLASYKRVPGDLDGLNMSGTQKMTNHKLTLQGVQQLGVTRGTTGNAVVA
jgi:hypothetical protein